jgi:hypothetical protein
MLATVLQISGFIAGIVFLIVYYATGWRLAPSFFMASFSVHFVGDWLAAFLKSPLLIAKFNISDAVKPKQFTQFVGLMLAVAAVLLLAFGHLAWGGAIGFFGLALALTGFVWDLIYP